ncbi:Hexose carrier protein HEX6 [Platanthera guangdongensis]|uniref:Hexose carrier protein HEX6 n=1 Tax=Platanthera guangdongensis TaxID=2320717 RepID=A0ABR2MJT8_9ASPA
MGGAAVDVYMLILSRILLGFGVGFTNHAVPIYLSEIAPPRYRGAITGGFDASIVLGIFVANLINYGTQKIKSGWGWRISLSSAALPAMFLFVGVIFLPDTPTSIIHRGGDIRVARRVLQRIRGTAEVDEELNDISVAAAAASKVAFSTNSFLLLLGRNYRPHLVMAIALPMFVNITGVSAVNFYAPVMFRTIGQNESSSLMSTVITRGIAFVFTLTAALAAVDRIGRRTLYLTGGAVMVASHVALGTVLKEELRDHGTVSEGSAYAVVLIVCVFVAAFGWSWGPLTWLFTGEIFPMEIRSAGMSTMVIINFLMNFAVAQSLIAVLCGLKAGLFFLFGGGVVVMTAFVYWLMPETKGVPMEKMGSIWAEHWYWKRFVDHDMDESCVKPNPAEPHL